MKVSYRSYFWFRFILGGSLLIYAVCTIIRFSALTLETKEIFHIYEIVFWTLGPPAWFFVEYYLMDNGTIILPPGEKKDKFLAEAKNYADTASKIWAAVLAVLVFMYPK
ncbi:hypothetical protein [Methyloglobulus sp.]|uniref:hypothetical protein n=1 Tax=Methyloglobulus sp. TaxID=2518622 RepID=UPI00398A3115